MININRRGIKDIYTGKNLINIANSIIAMGPDDKLKAPDGYDQPSTSSKSTIGSQNSDSGCECSTTESLSQAIGRHSGVSVPSGSNPNLFQRRADGTLKDSRTGTPIGDLGLSLWEQMFCRQTTSGGSGRRNKLSILSAALFLRNLGCTGKELARRLGMQSNTLQVDPRDLQRRALRSLGGSAANLSSRDRDVITRKLMDTQGVDKDRLRVTVDGQEKTFDSYDYDGITSTANLINAVNGNANLIEILDNEVEFAIIDTILENAIDQGIPGAIDLIDGQVTDPAYARKLYINRISQAAEKSDLDTVKRIIELTDAATILSVHPNIVKDILAAYEKPKGADIASEYVRLDDTLTLLDTNWYYAKRGSDDYINLSVFNRASDDAVLVLGQNQALIPSLHIRERYPRLDIGTLISRQHRRLVLRK